MRMFGEPDVLIPAIKLIDMPGIFIDEAIEVVEYNAVPARLIPTREKGNLCKDIVKTSEAWFARPHKSMAMSALDGQQRTAISEL